MHGQSTLSQMETDLLKLTLYKQKRQYNGVETIQAAGNFLLGANYLVLVHLAGAVGQFFQLPTSQVGFDLPFGHRFSGCSCLLGIALTAALAALGSGLLRIRLLTIFRLRYFRYIRVDWRRIRC